MVRMSNVWDRTTAFVAAHRGDLTVIALLGIALPSAASAIVDPLSVAPDGTTRMVVSITGILALLITIWGQLGITALTLADGGGVGRAMATASSRFLPLLGAVIPVALGAVLLALPFILILLASGADLAQMGAPGYKPPVTPGVGLAMFAYLIVWVPLMLFLAARLALIAPIVIAEHLSFRAIGRSWALTRGLAFKIIGVLLIYAVVVIVAVFATRIVAGTVTRLLLPSEEPVSAALVLTAITVALVTALFSVLSTVFVAQLYKAVAATPSNGT